MCMQESNGDLSDIFPSQALYRLLSMHLQKVKETVYEKINRRQLEDEYVKGGC